MNRVANKTPILLSIIIVNFETPDYTLECIRSLYKNSPHCAFEVIVIDNGSKDDSLGRLRREAPQVLCIETGANLGFSQANNLGINNARGNFVLLLNSDTKILDNILDKMLEYLMASPEVGAMGPRQLYGNGKLQLSWGSFPTLISEAFRKVLHYRLSLNDLKIRDYLEEKFAGSTDVDWVSGSCFMARKEALTDAGLLDGRFFMYFEDIDLCRRIKDVGWRIHYNSDITLIHYGGVSAKRNMLRVLVEYRRSQIYFTKKYYGFAGVATLKWLLFLKYTFYLVHSGAAYLRDLVFASEAKESFAKLLLSKKTIELVFSRYPQDVAKSLEKA
ncbi:MAG: glycosyltransferase family 2 protein [Candidatus Omnitrophica bacterium]|nr:glycosyltransferase family 2 protein [Candidatus Omnitrophota bacterium]